MKLGILYSYRYFCFYYFFTLSGNTGSHSKLATTMCGPPPLTPPSPRVNIYSTRLQFSALLCCTGSVGGGGGARRPGAVHILGLLGVVHTFINGRTTLRNLCLRTILFVNASQSDSNSLNIIILLHCLRLYIQYLVQWKHMVTSSVDSLF